MFKKEYLWSFPVPDSTVADCSLESVDLYSVSELKLTLLRSYKHFCHEHLFRFCPQELLLYASHKKQTAKKGLWVIILLHSGKKKDPAKATAACARWMSSCVISDGFLEFIASCTSPQYSSVYLCGILTAFLETTLKRSQNGTVYLIHPLFIQHLLQSRCSPGAWSPNKQQGWETSSRTRHICLHMHHTCKYISYTEEAHIWQPWKGAWKHNIPFQSIGSKSSVKVKRCFFLLKPSPDQIQADS